MYGIAVANDGTIFASTQNLPKILKVVNGAVSDFAGSGLVLRRDGSGANASFVFPTQMTMGADGNLYVAERLGSAIRRVTPAAEVTTVAGAEPWSVVDGPRSVARLVSGAAITFDANDNAFVADVRVIRKITPDGVVSTIAGNASEPGGVDGNGANARFLSARSIVAGRMRGSPLRWGSRWPAMERSTSPNPAASPYAAFRRVST